MAKLKDLYDLVKCLNASEKRYLKMQGSFQQGGKQYLALFDIIDKQESYNKQTLTSELKSIKNLARNQDYLFEFILHCMRNHARKNSPLDELINGMLDIVHLHRKRLHTPCLQLIRKLKAEAIQAERFLYVPFFDHYEMMCTHDLTYKNVTREDVEAFNEERMSHIGQLENFTAFENLANELNFEVHRHQFKTNSGGWKELQPLFEHPLLDQEENATSLSSLSRFYMLHIFRQSLNGETDGAYSTALERMTRMEENPEFIKGQPIQYISALNVALTLSCETLDMPRFEEVSEKLQGMLGFSAFQDNLINIRLMMVRLAVYNFLGEVGKGLPQVAGIDSLIDTSKPILAKRIIMFVHAAGICASANRWEETLNWVNRVLDISEKNLLQMHYSQCLILRLITYYEMGSHKLVGYSLVSVYRYLRRQERLLPFEKVMIKALKKLLRTQNAADLSERLLPIRDELKEVFSSGAEIHANSYFDFVSWVESKIENVTYGEVVRRKGSSRLESTTVSKWSLK